MHNSTPIIFADKMPTMTWKGFGPLGPHVTTVEEAILGLAKVATSTEVQCHFKQNVISDIWNGAIKCKFIQPVRKVAVFMRGITLFISIDDVNPIYRTRLLRYGRVTVPLE